ncbi:MAG: hypothetical protein GF333_02400 [Candidatus Omnitrophica bacterium]|nr:hypothetical protein [Candidatus Omnitrophota bacterium]
MNRFFRVMSKIAGICVCGGLMFSWGAAFAEGGLLEKMDLDIAIEGSLDFYSDYVWRGFVLDRDPVIQPGFNISGYGLTFSFWSSWDAANEHGSQSDEIDYVIDYTKELDDLLSLSVGHTYYDFPAADAYSREFYVGVGVSRIPGTDIPVETSLTYYRDYGDQNAGGGLGNYFSLDVAYSQTISEDPGVTLDYGLHFGYNRKLFLTGTSGYDLGLSMGLSLPLTDRLTMTPSVNYSIPFGDLKDSADGDQEARFYTGVGFWYAL